MHNRTIAKKTAYFEGGYDLKILSENKHELDGLVLHTIKTEKYKTNTILLKLSAPLEEETVTHRALLPYVLQSATASLSSSKELQGYLEDLYGASLQVDLMKKGEHHVMTFRVDVANEKYLRDQTPLLEKSLRLLGDVLTAPLLENGVFKEDIVAKEKRALKQRIQAVFDDKMRYANLRLVEEMCKNEPYHLHVNGRLEDIEGITAQSLYDYYKNMLTENSADLYVIGDIQEDEVVQYTKDIFSFEKRGARKISPPAQMSVEKENVVEEKQPVKQGKLNMGYRTNIVYGDDDYFALQVYNGIYGGFSHSKLFANVREKESLAYYAASRVESHKGLLMVMSGIDMKNYDKAVSIIKEQSDAMKNGDFDENTLSQTKAVIRNQLLETVDTARGLVEVMYHNELTENKVSIDEYLKRIEAVTKEEVVAVAQKVQLDTIYFLKGEGGE